MGCGISKFNDVQSENGEPNSIHHPLKHKIEEMPQKNSDGSRSSSSSSGAEGNLVSSKLVLIDDGGAGDSDGRKIRSSLSPSCMDEHNNKPGLGIVLEKEEETQNDEEEEENDGARLSDFDGSLYVGSPSFREYCNSPCESDKKGEAEGDNAGGNVDMENYKAGTGDRDRDTYINKNENNYQKEQRKGQIPEEVQETSRGKRRGRRFRKVFPVIRRPAAVKKLINVTTCNNSNVGSRHPGAGKLPQNKAPLESQL